MQRRIWIAAVAVFVMTVAHAGTRTKPITFYISNAATANVSCSNGVCEPTGGNANLNVSDLEALLAAGNLQINDSNGNIRARNVTVKDPFSWSAATELTVGDLGVGNTISILGAGSVSASFEIKKGAKIQCADLTCNINGATPVNSLQGLANAIAANPQGAFALVHSYDAGADGPYASSPIGTNFLGYLDGLGNTISNITVNSTAGCCVGGLFLSLSEASVSNLNLSNLSVTSIGGAAGFAYESFGEIINVSVTGSVVGGSSWDVGGLVADNYGSISSSHSTAAVSVAANSTNANVGGVAGLNYGELEFTYATGVVTAGGSATNVNVGGLVGANFSNIEGSFATGNVSAGNGSGAVGGAVGLNAQGGTLDETYAEGAVAGGEGLIVGGLLGANAYQQIDNLIEYCYSIGTVSGGNGSIVGGLIGENNSREMEYNYWDTTTSGTNVGVGLGNETSITGMTTAQLQSGLPPGFDPKHWAESAKTNDGLPYLLRNIQPK